MIDERISKILDWMADRVSKTENFVLEQAPDVIQQIVTMDAVDSMLVGACLVLLAGVIAMVCAIIMYRTSRTKNPDTEKSTAYGMTTFIGGFAVVVVMFFAVANFRTCIKATYAPKGYLMERIGVLKDRLSNQP